MWGGRGLILPAPLPTLAAELFSTCPKIASLKFQGRLHILMFWGSASKSKVTPLTLCPDHALHQESLSLSPPDKPCQSTGDVRPWYRTSCKMHFKGEEARYRTVCTVSARLGKKGGKIRHKGECAGNASGKMPKNEAQEVSLEETWVLG